MAGSRSVVGGLRAAQSYAQSSAGRAQPHPSYVSPLLGQYAQWTMGRQSMQNALPRDPLDFLTGAFGPLAPIKPIGVDQPPKDSERPEPRRWQYPVAWNMPVGVPGSEGLKLADFGTLRLYSDIYCGDPSTKVLCADFSWKQMGLLREGDEVIAFDENQPAPRQRRRFRHAQVTSCDHIIRPCYRLTMADEREVVISAEHRWLTANGWVETALLAPGDQIRDLGVPWSEGTSWEEGYLAGIFDAEAWFSGGISFGQKPGVVLDLTRDLLQKQCFNVPVIRECRDGLTRFQISGIHDCLEFLGRCRPKRLLSKVASWLEGAVTPDTFMQVESLEFLGDQEVIALGTTTGTFFAEGLFSHNSVARACIQLRKDEILGVGWDIGPTNDASKAMRNNRSARKDFGERRAELLRFFRRPDPNYNDFTTWLEAVLEDILVVDALSIYLHPARLPGKGILGSDLAALDLIAGDTIRPLLDLRGGSPAPPNPAYQQYLYGVPRADLMTILTGEDIKDMDAPAHTYRGDQLLYLPRNPRSWTPYGQSPLERCIVPVITGLRRQQYQMDYYLEGSIPGMFLSVGDPDMTPNQIREFQDTMNALAGDQAWKHKIIAVPAGSKFDPQKPPELSDQTDEVLMTQVLMAYSVMPMELGILPKIAATQTPSAAMQMAKAQQDISERKTLKPDLLWLKNALFDKVIQGVCGQHDMEWRWDGLEEDKDELTATQLLTEQISFGLTSIDEARIEIGRDPWGLEITQDPGWATAAGFLPLGAINPDTGMPRATEGLQPNGVPAIPGSPAGSSRSGTAKPGQGAPSGPMKRPASSTQPNEKPLGRRPQSPGHDAAASSESAARAKPRPVPKAAAMAELGALARHLHKGREISTWETRHLPSGIVAKMAEDMAMGLTIETAAAAAEARVMKIIDGETVKAGVYEQWEEGLIPETPGIGPQWDDPAGPGGAAQPGGKPVKPAKRVRKADAKAQQVVSQLEQDYPESSLDWVRDDVESWKGPVLVPLKDIDFDNRQKWNAWHERDRVRQIAAKQQRREGQGRHLKPAVLVDTPDTDRGTTLRVIDGHHRSLAALHNGQPLWAWIGKVNRTKGPWDEFHAHQRTEGAGGSEFAAA